MRLTAIGTMLFLAWASVGHAAPLDVDSLPADTKWVVHVDVDALGESVVVQKYFTQWMKQGGKEQVAKVYAKTGVDVRDELHSLTLFNVGYEEKAGVLVVRADMDRDLLVSKAKEAPDSKLATYGDHKLYSWTDKDKKVTGAFFTDEVLVFGSSIDLVKGALDALSGKAPGLEAPGEARIPEGTILVGSAWGLSDAEWPEKVKLPQGTEQISIVVGEHEGTSFMGGEVVATTETAGQVKEVLEGVRAMGMLQVKQAPKARKLLESMTIKRSGKKVQIEVGVPTVEIIKGIEEHKAKQAAAKKGK